MLYGVADLVYIKQIQLKKVSNYEYSNNTSSDLARAPTTALQRIGINLYRYVMSASTSSDNSMVYNFWITRKDERKKERLQEIMTATALNQRAPNRAPLDILLSQRLVTTSRSIRDSGPYMGR